MMKLNLTQFRLWVLEQVMWAETVLKGKSGKEKRAAVVQHLDDLIELPWWLEWMDGPAIGFLVDNICDKLNLLTNRDFSHLCLSGVEKNQIADTLSIPLGAVENLVGKTFDDRLDELEEKVRDFPSEATDSL